MMRKSTLLLFLFLSLAFAVAAQKPKSKPTPKPAAAPALKGLPDATRYTSPDKTFSLWMTLKPKDVTAMPAIDPVKGSAKTQYRWDLAEGFFAVTAGTYEHRTFDTEADVAELAEFVKGSITRSPETKLVSEKPFTDGKWRGSDMILSSGDWIRTLVRVMAAGNKVYTLTATVDLNTPGAETLLLKSMNSFKVK